MTYEIELNGYGRYVLFRTKPFIIIDSSTKKKPIEALRKDIMRRLERRKNVNVSRLPRSHDPRQKPEKNVEMPSMRS